MANKINKSNDPTYLNLILQNCK